MTVTPMRPASPCPICRSVSHNAGRKNGYEIARCTRCEHTFVVDIPPTETLQAHYEYERGLQYVPRFVFPVLATLMKRFAAFRATERFLDVGFGAGAMLRAASDYDWHAYGIEISHSAVTAARAAGLRADIVEGDFMTYPYPTGSFDIVVFDGVVANLPEPGLFFARAHEVLRRGGLMYVTTPHGRGLSSRVLGPRWSACAPPEHLHLFSRMSANLLAANAGFGQIKTYTRGVNPDELLRAISPSRAVRRSTEVNAMLMRTTRGRLVKGIANAALLATGLGDQLYLEAIA